MTELTTTATAPPTAPVHEERYEEFLGVLTDRFAKANVSAGTVFTTSVPEGALWAAFLDGIPAERRQHYTCRSCERFVNRFGGLVTIDEDGAVRPLFWADMVQQLAAVPPFFRDAVFAVAREVIRARVDGVFVSAENEWGTLSNTSKKPPFEWFHMGVVPNYAAIHKSTLVTPEGAAAEKRQDFEMLCRGLADFPVEVVRNACALLRAGSLPRPEKVLPAAEWLLTLHEARGGTRNDARRDALTWRAVGTAPAGFCHVRTSALGRLLELIKEGRSFAEIKASFSDVMDPTQYQRPQAPPTEGNIAAAEAIVAKLGLAPSLARRFARLEDVEALWKPRPAPEGAPAPGVFANLKRRTVQAAPPVEAPPAVMTWVRFIAEVLPGAESIELLTPPQLGPFMGMLTAVDPSAPPIFQWDRPDRRNTVSWYFYDKGSSPVAWNLRPSSWVPVTAICYVPSMWANPEAFPHQGKQVFFLLLGAKDIRYVREPKGASIFPETLRSELHAVRSTIEAFSKEAPVLGADEATACGVGFSASAEKPWNVDVRVTAKGTRVTYRLDRWH